MSKTRLQVIPPDLLLVRAKSASVSMAVTGIGSSTTLSVIPTSYIPTSYIPFNTFDREPCQRIRTYFTTIYILPIFYQVNLYPAVVLAVAPTTRMTRTTIRPAACSYKQTKLPTFIKTNLKDIIHSVKRIHSPSVAVAITAGETDTFVHRVMTNWDSTMEPRLPDKITRQCGIRDGDRPSD